MSDAKYIQTIAPKSPIIDTRPFDYNAETGVETVFHYHEDGSVSFEKRYDSQAILDFNQEQFNSAPESWKGELHKFASIPNDIYQELVAQGITKDQKKFKAWLNDRDHLKFRTKSGTV